MAYRPLNAVILAAGEGTRMRSSRPKPLHFLCGRPMVLHVVNAFAELPLERVVVVVGHGAEPVTKTLQEHAPDDLSIDFVEQTVQRGTGDATMVALTAFDADDDEDDVIIVPGDTPLLRPETLALLAREHRLADAAATVLTARLDDAGAYGRIVRDKDDHLARIVEATDATDDELAIGEINTGIYCFRRSLLAPALRRISPENAQGEYYLTSVVEVLVDAGYKVLPVVADDPAETQGVNDRAQLANAEAELRARINLRLMGEGVTMIDPARTYVDASVRIGADTTLWPGTMLHGRTVLGQGCKLGPDARLTDCTVGDRAVIERATAELATIGDDAVVGPYAVLPPGSTIAEGERTGPFYTANPTG